MCWECIAGALRALLHSLLLVGALGLALRAAFGVLKRLRFKRVCVVAICALWFALCAGVAWAAAQAATEAPSFGKTAVVLVAAFALVHAGFYLVLALLGWWFLVETPARWAWRELRRRYLHRPLCPGCKRRRER